MDAYALCKWATRAALLLELVFFTAAEFTASGTVNFIILKTMKTINMFTVGD